MFSRTTLSDNLAKFIPSYPSRDDSKFSYEIFRRKEFNDLKLDSSEPVPDDQGIPLMSQELQARFFSPNTDYKSGLLCHGMGTGKTCVSSLIVENFKNTLVGNAPRRRALVLVPNEDIERSYRAQVAYQCTKDIYQPQFTEAELQETGNEAPEMTRIKKERRLRSAVAKSYEIVTYNQFFFRTSRSRGIVKTIPRFQNNDYIKKMYSDRIIIIDEAHNLRIQPKKTRKPSLLEELQHIEPGSPIEMYNEFHNFLHTVENCRILLLTGTPIWDQVHEIASLMNLILPMNEQLKIRKDFIREYFDDKGSLIPDKADLLRDRFRGRVSFLRPMITSADRQEIGVKAPWLKYVTIYPSAMSDFQYKFAKESLEKVEKVKVTRRSKSGKAIIKERDVKGGPVRIKARDASSFVFPVFSRNGDKLRKIGGVYGTEGFEANVESFAKGTRYQYKSQDVKNAIRDNLKEYSSKFAAIIKWIKDYPDELVFIYDEFVTAGGGGAVNLALILQTHGFEWAKTAKSISSPSAHGKKRFAVLTSNKATIHAPKQIEDFIESFNLPDNAHAERCQIIIGSRKIAEGLTIKNVRQAHVTMPHWNIPAIDQALGRIFRVGSHDALSENERTVRIFRHVAVKEYDEDEDDEKHDTDKGFPQKVGFSSIETMDTIVYKIAEDKEYYNTQIYRLLKEISWDCPETYRRNVLPGDQDYSRDCDYGKCNYRCDGYPEIYIEKNQKVWDYTVPEKDILRETYDLYYSVKDMNQMIEVIRNLFRTHFSLHLNTITQLIGIDNKKESNLLLHVLDYIINAQIQISNSYGFVCYLKEQGNLYFLDNTVSVYSNYSDVIYVSNILVTERTSLEDLVEIFQLSEDKVLVDKFCAAPKANASLLSKMHYRTLIILLEKVHEINSRASKKYTSRERQAIDEIMDRIGMNLITMPENIVIHNMYASEYTGLGYNVTVQEIKPTGLIRVFHPDTKSWKYVETDEEEERYIDYLKQLQKSNREISWDENPRGFYGFRDRDGKFKIREKASGGKKDTKGSVCIESSWQIPRLYALLKTLSFLPDTDEHKKVSKHDLITSIKAQPELTPFIDDLTSRSWDDLRRILALKTLSKSNICDKVEEWFKTNKMFYDLRV